MLPELCIHWDQETLRFKPHPLCSACKHIYLSLSHQVFSSPTKPMGRNGWETLSGAGWTFLSTNWGAALGESRDKRLAKDHKTMLVAGYHGRMLPTYAEKLGASHSPTLLVEFGSKGLPEWALRIWLGDTSDVWNRFALGLLNAYSMWSG